MAEFGRIGMVGGGNMGSALVAGILKAGVAEPGDLVVAEKDPARGKALGDKHGVSVVEKVEGMGVTNILILAVKPFDIPAVLNAAKDDLTPQTLVISVAAGLTMARIAQLLPENQPLVRAMPNTPALVGRGVTAVAPSQGTTREQVETARKIFESVGRVLIVLEQAMDTVTGLSGSGPAYVMLFIEALTDAGVRQGLDRGLALTLAVETVAGSAELLIQSGQHPVYLKEMVTSPGGTTISGLHALERGAFKGLIMDAVAEAVQRSKEIAS